MRERYSYNHNRKSRSYNSDKEPANSHRLSPQYSESSASEQDIDARVSWKQEQSLAHRKYFQKFEKPSVTLSEQEVLENKDKILGTLRVARKSSTSERRDVDKAFNWNSSQEKHIWEKPRRSLIRHFPTSKPNRP